MPLTPSIDLAALRGKMNARQIGRRAAEYFSITELRLRSGRREAPRVSFARKCVAWLLRRLVTPEPSLMEIAGFFGLRAHHTVIVQIASIDRALANEDAEVLLHLESIVAPVPVDPHQKLIIAIRAARAAQARVEAIARELGITVGETP